MLSVGDQELAEKIRRVEELLCAYYGERHWNPSDYPDDLVGALVATILSQNTSDLNSGRAYLSLKKSFPLGWDSVRLAKTQTVADAIRCGGLAETKSIRIQDVLDDLYQRNGSTSLEHLRTWSDDAIRDYLTSFKGIGPKTAACILMFNLGRPVLAVDTHVHRVSQRLGLIGRKTNADRAHIDLLKLLNPRDVYSYHVHAIEHGRRTCYARRPKCDTCPVKDECTAFFETRGSIQLTSLWD